MQRLALYLLLFNAIFILGSPHAIIHWLVHIACLVFSLIHLHKVSKYYLFWFVLALCYFCASEPRFSIEYYFICMGFMAWGMSDAWLKLERKQQAYCLISIFAMLFLTNFTQIGFAEKGAYLRWAPIFLALYFDPIKNKFLFGASGAMLFFSNKTSTLLSFITAVLQKIRSKIFFIISGLIILTGIFFVEGFHVLYERSVQSRFMIWLSSLKGFIASPIWGHGFKTFILDYPEYKILGNTWATLRSQQIAHGHSLFFNYLFELGLVGVIILALLFYMIYKRAPRAFLPLLVLSLLDVPISLFGEFLLAALILYPYFHNKTDKADLLLKKIPKKIYLPTVILVYALALYSYVPSAIGHFYYDAKKYGKAVKWDKANPLYRLIYGVLQMESNRKHSFYEFRQAVKLAPNIGYLHGFLASMYFGELNFYQTRKEVQQCMKLSGSNSHWNFLYAVAHSRQPETFHNYMNKALKANPRILNQVSNPKARSRIVIGGDHYDPRVLSFCRKGPPIHLPLPYIENCPKDPEQLRQLIVDLKEDH